jgi:hypothetical protein
MLMASAYSATPEHLGARGGGPIAFGVSLDRCRPEAQLVGTPCCDSRRGLQKICLFSPTLSVRGKLTHNRHFDQASNCFRPRRQIALLTAPLVYKTEKSFRHPHLKYSVLCVLGRSARPTFSGLPFMWVLY